MDLELDTTKYTQKIIFDFHENGAEYEPEVVNLIKSVLRPEDCFVDCGAHIGFFSILAGEICKKGTVYSFEPEKENYEALVNNIQLNNYQHIKSYNVAVGDENKKEMLFINKDNDGGHALWDISKHSFNKKTKKDLKLQETEMVTLDSVIKEPVRLIKIDVEGSEFKVLKGAKELLSKYYPTVILEINDMALKEMGASKEEIYSFMFDLGYLGFDLETGMPVEMVKKIHKYVYNIVFLKLEGN